MSDEHHTELAAGKRAPALRFIFITATLDVIALGLMIPVLPNLVKALAQGSTADAAFWVGIFSSTWGLMQFVVSPIMGMMSDRFGRRPVILTSIFGLGIDFLFMALAPTLAWLYVGRIINGATAASFSTANAYVADITAPENRAKAFGMIGASFGIGFTVGPVIGGWLGDIDLRLPFFVCAAVALTNWLYGYFVLPESLPPERRVKRFDWKKANPVGSLKLLRSHPDLLGLASIGFLFQLAHNVLPSIFVLYMGERYHWNLKQVGLSLLGTGIAGIIVQTLLIGPAVKRIGERGALLVGLTFGVLGFAIYALAPTGLIYLCGIPVFALMSFTGPGMQGLMSRRVGPSEQGQLQGANASIQGITAIVGPQLFTLTYAWNLKNPGVLHLPGFPILIAAGLLALGFVIALGVAKPPKVSGEPASVQA
ncbi:DHA1 family tetracycline resistance protein-like MFS transporter [Caulobacter ginsengisoli]|uniref:DHA1 family tetracycline resistance protein-like MFS transporter n=1 Tax=Caulobacter ginsengisoli TaxID=400775 RepID=A0ABU0IL80_9CAUL|nr:TCR/Tet family MFS transporter [Caulobacter ginsengisoli]MDQ0462777.1 DHA1 family tetracycline resistance protein-like MFS transporter [Caulobacter ginsengisoli]